LGGAGNDIKNADLVTGLDKAQNDLAEKLNWNFGFIGEVDVTPQDKKKKLALAGGKGYDGNSVYQEVKGSGWNAASYKLLGFLGDNSEVFGEGIEEIKPAKPGFAKIGQAFKTRKVKPFTLK